MIGDDEDSFPLAVVQQDRGFGGGQCWGLRVSNCFGVDAEGIAQPGADEIEVVDAVIENFETGCGGEKCPELPGSVGSDLHLHIVQLAEQAGLLEGDGGEIVGGVSQLKVDCGGQSALTAVIADGRGLIESFAHGLLDQNGGSRGKVRQDGHDLRCRDRDIKDGVGWCEAYSFFDGAEAVGDSFL